MLGVTKDMSLYVLIMLFVSVWLWWGWGNTETVFFCFFSFFTECRLLTECDGVFFCELMMTLSSFCFPRVQAAHWVWWVLVSRSWPCWERTTPGLHEALPLVWFCCSLVCTRCLFCSQYLRCTHTARVHTHTHTHRIEAEIGYGLVCVFL